MNLNILSNDDWSTLKKLTYIRGMSGGSKLTEYTATGNPAVFETNKVKPLRGLTIPFTPVQDLHGYANPWPSGGNVNKLNDDFELGGISDQDGTDTEADNTLRTKSFSKVTAEATYYMCLPAEKSCVLYYYSAANAESYVGNSIGAVTAGTINIPADANYVRIMLNPIYGTTYNNNVALNYPASNTSYVPYSNICPITGWTGFDIMTAADAIPSAYQRVEYVSGVSGTPSWIDTGIPGGNNNLIITGKFSPRSHASYMAFFGNYISELVRATRLIFATTQYRLFANLNYAAS